MTYLVANIVAIRPICLQMVLMVLTKLCQRPIQIILTRLLPQLWSDNNHAREVPLTEIMDVGVESFDRERFPIVFAEETESTGQEGVDDTCFCED